MEEEFQYSIDKNEFLSQDLNFTENDSMIGSWLSLIHFPDETRVQLTKRGRNFIFQSKIDKSQIDLVGRARWNQFRSNTEVPIPLGIIKTLLDNDEKDLFLASFSVIGIGSQKLIIPIKLPIKVPGSPIIKMLALLCLTRNVFNTGNFQTDNEAKATSFIEIFHLAFGVELPSGVNKRGNYIRIPLQIIQAITKFFTGEETASIHKLIESLNRFSTDDILSFLNTWFIFYRIYRNIKRTDQLFIFRRKNETTDEIANLLQKCDVELYPGTIQENGNIISAYVVKNTEQNQSILDLTFINGDLEGKPDHLLLLKRIMNLTDEIKLKDEKIGVLNQELTKLNQELAKEQETKLAASYSRFYFEARTKKLEEKFLELKMLREDLEKENNDLRRILSKSGSNSFLDEKNRKQRLSYTDINLLELSDITLNDVKEKIIQSTNYNLSSFNAFIKYIKQYTTMPRDKSTHLMIQGEEEDELVSIEDELTAYQTNFDDINSSNFAQSNLTNPTLTQKLIKALTILMAKKENWVMLALAFDENKVLTEFEMRDLLNLELSESRPLIANLLKSGQLETGNKTKNGETGYYLKPNLVKELRNELNLLLRKKTIPNEIKSEWKEIFQI
jgi:hypothetical protein